MKISKLKSLSKRYPIIRLLLYPGIVVIRFFVNRSKASQIAIIDNLRKIQQNDPIIKVSEFDGVFSVDVNSSLFERILLSGYYEPDIVKCCLKYLDKDKDVIDVGANVGFFTVLFSKKLNNGKVLAFEPTKYAIERLYKNIELNGAESNVIVFEGVASDSSGTVEIKTIKGKEEYSSLGVMEHPSIASEKYDIESVESITIDEAVKQYSLKPGFIKVDVEGAEHLVFGGAQEVLSKYKPVIISEIVDSLLVKNGSSAKEVIDMIRKHGYRIIDPLDPSADPCKINSGNILCIPE